MADIINNSEYGTSITWDVLDKMIEEYEKNHHLQFEILIAWDDDDEFEHEGYYDNVDDAIAALMKYKEKNL